jgi:spore cortex formation protein SpoVR/YcgB (stage V sporulation)
LYDEGSVTDEFMLEVLQNHTNVVYQPQYNSPHFSGINPYTLGFNMMQDIKRICENPTEEDQRWFPELANTHWQTQLDHAMRYFKDESFISQYLSPHLIRDLKLFLIQDNDELPELKIQAIHNEEGYRLIRESLSKQYNLSFYEPNIQVFNVALEGDRTLTLHYYQHNRVPLDAQAHEVLKHLYSLWKFPVKLITINEDGHAVTEYNCPNQI